MAKEFDIKQMHTEHEIIICFKCKGTGLYSWEVCVDHHKNDYETEYMTCSLCHGTGRLFKTKKWQEITEPFDPKMGDKNLRRTLK